MRKKLHVDEKRSAQIGIKVKNETKQKIQYIASLEGNQMSTQIDEILREYITKYFKKHGINWNTLTPDEKGEK